MRASIQLARIAHDAQYRSSESQSAVRQSSLACGLNLLAVISQRRSRLFPQQSNNPTHVLQYLLYVLSDFRTQFVPGLCPLEQCRADHPSNRKEDSCKTEA